jgi:hypothetical protein
MTIATIILTFKTQFSEKPLPGHVVIVRAAHAGKPHDISFAFRYIFTRQNIDLDQADSSPSRAVVPVAQKQAGAQPPQPAVAGIVVVARVPVLLHRETGNRDRVTLRVS